MTLPNSSRPISNSNADLDVNSLMNNREFQEILQDYFQGASMTLDEFLETLPRFMMENYGLEGEADEEDDIEDNEYEESDEYFDDIDEGNFLELLRRNRYRSEPIEAASNPSESLFRSLLAGRRAQFQEIPLRPILPQSPPPSPVPNIVNTGAFRRNGPQVPNRPNTTLQRIPSQLRRTTTTPTRQEFDPNAPEECKSPHNQISDIAIPYDRNNNLDDLPLTAEFMRRYGYGRISLSGNKPAELTEDQPER